MSITNSIFFSLIAAVLVALQQGPGTSAPVIPQPPAVAAGARFEMVDVFVDSGQEALAAWQVEFSVTAGAVEIVGIERGDNPGFNDPPYYDPAALQKDRIVIGAFNLSDNLPVGKSKVARLHLHVSGAQKPVYAAKLMVAGNKQGKAIAAKASVEQSLTKAETKPEGDPK